MTVSLVIEIVEAMSVIRTARVVRIVKSTKNSTIVILDSVSKILHMLDRIKDHSFRQHRGASTVA